VCGHCGGPVPIQKELEEAKRSLHLGEILIRSHGIGDSIARILLDDEPPMRVCSQNEVWWSE
jgi:hypothetical protein